MEPNFYSMVMKHFQYLVTDYSFAVKKLEGSERAPGIEGRVEFETSTTFVTVSGEQWTVNTSVGRAQDDKYRFFLDLLTIHEYSVLTESDKKLICSLDPKDDRKARMIIQQVKLSHSKSTSNNVVEDIAAQLSDYSKWLRQYAEPLLRGDFSQWLEIYEYKVGKARATHIRSGKEEFVRTPARNKDERISIFQSKFDYLEKLREEYRKR